jgi:hypothetical protein
MYKEIQRLIRFGPFLRNGILSQDDNGTKLGEQDLTVLGRLSDLQF